MAAGAHHIKGCCVLQTPQALELVIVYALAKCLQRDLHMQCAVSSQHCVHHAAGMLCS